MTLEPGAKVGAWTLIKFQPLPGYGPKKRKFGWLCVCDCGTRGNHTEYSLTNGRTRSCGCQTGGVWKRVGLGRITRHAGQQ